MNALRQCPSCKAYGSGVFLSGEPWLHCSFCNWPTAPLFDRAALVRVILAEQWGQMVAMVVAAGLDPEHSRWDHVDYWASPGLTILLALADPLRTACGSTSDRINVIFDRVRNGAALPGAVDVVAERLGER